MKLFRKCRVTFAVSLVTIFIGCSNDAVTDNSTTYSQIAQREEHDWVGSAGHETNGRDEHIRMVETVASNNGNDRLIRKDVESIGLTSTTMPDARFFDFHSVVWQRLNDGVWIDHLTITKADFQRDCSNRRWIKSLHSFDPTKGSAILEIGEEIPENANESVVRYTWREWNLTDNLELKTIPLDDETTIYACPMCEEQKHQEPGTCPICEMQLEPTLGPLPLNDK